MNELVSKFEELYKHVPVLVRVPGSLNTEGESTQYGKSFVLPAANSEEICFAIALNGLHLCRVHAYNQRQSDAFFLRQRMSRSSRSWENAIKSVIAQFSNAGYKLEGFDLVFGSQELSGTDFSSAAVERGFACALNHLFDFNLEEFELANTEQKVEHENA